MTYPARPTGTGSVIDPERENRTCPTCGIWKNRFQFPPLDYTPPSKLVNGVVPCRACQKAESPQDSETVTEVPTTRPTARSGRLDGVERHPHGL